MTDQPLDEQQRFAQRVTDLRRNDPPSGVELMLDRIAELEAQHDAEQREIAELRKIAEMVAKGSTIIETRPGVTWCAACLFVWGPDSHAVADEMHADDCLVTKARVWLDAHDAR